MSNQLPPLPVPGVVSMRQARLALLGAGLLDNVESALASLEGIDGRAARIQWEFSSEVSRYSDLIEALAPALGLNDEQIDELFRRAAVLP